LARPPTATGFPSRGPPFFPFLKFSVIVPPAPPFRTTLYLSTRSVHLCPVFLAPLPRDLQPFSASPMVPVVPLKDVSRIPATMHLHLGLFCSLPPSSVPSRLSSPTDEDSRKLPFPKTPFIQSLPYAFPPPFPSLTAKMILADHPSSWSAANWQAAENDVVPPLTSAKGPRFRPGSVPAGSSQIDLSLLSLFCSQLSLVDRLNTVLFLNVHFPPLVRPPSNSLHPPFLRHTVESPPGLFPPFLTWAALYTLSPSGFAPQTPTSPSTSSLHFGGTSPRTASLQNPFSSMIKDA